MEPIRTETSSLLAPNQGDLPSLIRAMDPLTREQPALSEAAFVKFWMASNGHSNGNGAEVAAAETETRYDPINATLITCRSHSIEQQHRLFERMGHAMLADNEAAVVENIVRLYSEMSPQARQTLLRKLRSPKFAPGLLKDHPYWPEVERGIEENRRAELAEVSTE